MTASTVRTTDDIPSSWSGHTNGQSKPHLAASSPGNHHATLSLLDERARTHGDFADNAWIAQKLKDVMRAERWASLTPVQREALDLIATKIGRIVSGDADHADHWMDIAGYAMLPMRR